MPLFTPSSHTHSTLQNDMKPFRATKYDMEQIEY